MEIKVRPLTERTGMIDLHDENGRFVGKANVGVRIMLADGFYVPERTCRPEKRWKEYSAWPYYVCSECGEPLNYRETEDDYELLPYCAGCGAKVIE